MRILRSILARIVVTVGVLVLGFWLCARFVVHTVNDGSIVSSMASTVLHQVDIQSMLTEHAETEIDSQLESQGIDPYAPSVQDELSDGIADAVGSEDFIDALVEIIKEVEVSVIAQLTDDSLPLGPVSVTVNISEPLYAALEQNPQLVSLIPASTIEPVTFELADEDVVDTVRSGYDWVERVNTWGIWIALGLLAIGFLLIRKKRWILPKLFLGVGIFTLGLWWVARWLDVEWIIGRLGDDASEDVKSTIRDVFPQETIDKAEGTLFKWAIAFLIVSAALYVFVWWFFRRLKARGEEGPDIEPEPAPVPVSAPGETSGAMAGEMPAEPMGESGGETSEESMGDPTGEEAVSVDAEDLPPEAPAPDAPAIPEEPQEPTA